MTKTANNYSESSIQILDGLEAVRKRPGMYIGSTDARGLHHLVYEIVDNSIDEVLAGFGDLIKVTINKDNSIVVEDRGRGIPTGMHSSGKSTPEVIFTVLHAGGKFGGENQGYKVSGGLHGVGSSVVNALSEFLSVTISRDGKINNIEFSNGGSKNTNLKEIGTTKKTGTRIHFKPDSNVFSTTIYNYDTLSIRLRESAFLNKGLKIILNDKRVNKSEEFFYENGIYSFTEFLNEGKKTIHSIKYFEGSHNKMELEIAFQFTKSYSENIYSFVNNVRTKDGGTHETGFKSAITKTFNEYATNNKLLKKIKKLEGADIREGLTAIISIRIPEDLLQFEGQTKAKLGTSEARGAVESVVSEKLTYFFEENKNIAIQLIDKAISAAEARNAARKAREDARVDKKRNKMETNLSGKLSPATGRNKDINELFLVEGDSAGGSAKQGRDRKFQAILPLRGKVINSEKSKIEDVLRNEEVNTIIHTIGAGLGQDFDITKSNYNKVIIMTDADTDGAHIQVLLLTFFFRYMQELVESGKVYIALPPLYKVTKKVRGKSVINYAWTENELKELTHKYKNYQIQRFKGLGEMNASQLCDTTMNPKTRTLIKVNIDDLADADQRISTLMGDKVEPRREWIEKNVVFENIDDFVIEGD